MTNSNNITPTEFKPITQETANFWQSLNNLGKAISDRDAAREAGNSRKSLRVTFEHEVPGEPNEPPVGSANH